MPRPNAVAACVLLVVAGCRAPSGTARVAGASPLLDRTNVFWNARAPESFKVRVETTAGSFVLDLHRDWAPHGVDRFFALTQAGFFDDSRFFRVVPHFIAQFGIAGDPAIMTVWRDATIPDDDVRASNLRGTMAFAMTGPNTRTTQLYVNLVDNSRLDAQGFAPIGRVVAGMDVVDKLYSGYGETAGGGVRRGNQGPLLKQGNAYLDKEYPRLDHLVHARVVTVE